MVFIGQNSSFASFVWSQSSLWTVCISSTLTDSLGVCVKITLHCTLSGKLPFFGGVAQLVSVWAYSRATGRVAQFGGFKGTVLGKRDSAGRLPIADQALRKRASASPGGDQTFNCDLKEQTQNLSAQFSRLKAEPMRPAGIKAGHKERKRGAPCGKEQSMLSAQPYQPEKKAKGHTWRGKSQDLAPLAKSGWNSQHVFPFKASLVQSPIKISLNA